MIQKTSASGLWGGRFKAFLSKDKARDRHIFSEELIIQLAGEQKKFSNDGRNQGIKKVPE